MSISRKFALWIVSVLLAAAGVSIYLFYVVEMRAEAKKLELFGKLSGRVIEESLMTFMLNRDNAGLNRKLDEVKAGSDTVSRVLLLDAAGEVRAASEKRLIGKKFSTVDPGCRECHEKGHRGILMNGNSSYRWAAPVLNKPVCHGCHDSRTRNNGLLIIDFSVSEFVHHVRQELYAGTAFIITALFMIGWMMVYLSETLVSRRLNSMALKMKDFQEGNFAVGQPVEGSDEITRLEIGFNELAQAITAREREKNRLVEEVNATNDQLQREIAGRERWERTLHEQLQFLQRMIDTIPMPIFYKDLAGAYLGCNKAFELFLGISKEKLVGKTVLDITPKELGDKYHDMDRELIAHPGVQVYEYSVKHADGSLRDVIFNKATFTDAERNVAGLIGAMHDITERKKIEAATRRAEQVIKRNYDTQTAINWILHISLENLTLDGILKQALDIILSIPWLSIESKGAIFLVEDEPYKLVMKAERGLSDHLHRECKIVPFGKCLCGRAAARGEVQFADRLDDRHEVTYDGIARHGHYCVPIMDAQRVLGVINMYLKEGHRRDDKEIEFLNAMASALAGVVQRKRTEDEREKLIEKLQTVLDTVSRSQQEWRNTFDSITDMIAILDGEFSIVKANRAFSAYFGLQPQQVIKRKCYELMHDGTSAVPNCPHRTTLTQKKAAAEEFLDKRTNRLFRVFTFPYHAPDGEVIGSIHISRDITDDKEKETRLIMSERLAALGQMASGIAHEINNPLASIAGCSEGLMTRARKGNWDAELFESYLGIIQEEVFRCKSITTAILSFVRKSSYEKKEVAINALLDKTLEIIGFQGRLKDIEIQRRYQPEDPVIRGNEGELRQVFLAVITNALDAMYDKGSLVLETAAQGDSSVIRISDTGSGISPENMLRIFDPFYTTKAERGGTGLGLSIARKIVANHNGTIQAVSDPGKGATIIITLPN